jgi:hypothetical protein
LCSGRAQQQQLEAVVVAAMRASSTLAMNDPPGLDHRATGS